MARKIIIIGTLHAGLTPDNELADVLDTYKPDQLFVEIKNENILSNNFSSYPSEMVFACEWARKKKIILLGFDSGINIFKEGVLPEDNQALIDEQKKIIKDFNWKDFNKRENNRLLDIKGLDQVVDRKKEEKREIEMLSNIMDNLIECGTVVILTGTAHLDFFENNLKGAIFPFRH